MYSNRNQKKNVLLKELNYSYLLIDTAVNDIKN